LEIARLQTEGEQRFRELAESLEKEVATRTRQLEHHTAELVKQSEDIRALSAQLLHTQNEERRHIARELHDSAGQILTVLNLNLGRMAEESTWDPVLAAELQGAAQLVQQLQQEIRTASYLLHPPLLDENGLASALEWYVRGVTERTGLAIDLQVSKDFGRVSKEVELIVFRLVQECLTNVHRHAHSDSATIRLFRDEHKLTLEVQDRGRGISAQRLSEIQAGASGVGIRGMKERVTQFAGNMTIKSDTSGTRVLVTIPASEALPMEQPRAAAGNKPTKLPGHALPSPDSPSI
jgi:signal transduction histidine kinase